MPRRHRTASKGVGSCTPSRPAIACAAIDQAGPPGLQERPGARLYFGAHGDGRPLAATRTPADARPAAGHRGRRGGAPRCGDVGGHPADQRTGVAQRMRERRRRELDGRRTVAQLRRCGARLVSDRVRAQRCARAADPTTVPPRRAATAPQLTARGAPGGVLAGLLEQLKQPRRPDHIERPPGAVDQLN